MSEKHYSNRKPIFKNKNDLKTTKHKLDEVLLKFDKFKGSDAKQQEFKEDLNKFFLSLRFHDKLNQSAIYFLEYLSPKFIGLLRKGEYNYENVIEVMNYYLIYFIFFWFRIF